MDLYFMALIPDRGLREQIRTLKTEIKRKYKAKHALKLPAHITLQIPFKMTKEEEVTFIKAVGSFAEEQPPFKIEVSGFDCFPPRVIFLKVLNQEPLKILHTQLQQVIEDILQLKDREKTLSIHPHITIASRDLSREAFKNGWSDFEKRDFKASFLADKIYLLKHNGNSWEVHHIFSFKKNDLSAIK